jgi:hypothetical protein
MLEKIYEATIYFCFLMAALTYYMLERHAPGVDVIEWYIPVGFLMLGLHPWVRGLWYVVSERFWPEREKPRGPKTAGVKMSMSGLIDGNAVLAFNQDAGGYLAVVLHDKFGWQLFAEYRRAPRETEIYHMWAVNNEGRAVDINGIHHTDRAEAKYSYGEVGRIEMIDRVTALGAADEELLGWARLLVGENPEHFGLIPSSARAKRVDL